MQILAFNMGAVKQNLKYRLFKVVEEQLVPVDVISCSTIEEMRNYLYENCGSEECEDQYFVIDPQGELHEVIKQSGRAEII